MTGVNVGRKCGVLVAALAMCAALAPAATAIPPAPGECPAYQNSGLAVFHCLVNYPGISVTVSPQIVRLGHVISVTESNSFPSCDSMTPNPLPCHTNSAVIGGFRPKFVPGDTSPAGQLPFFRLVGTTGSSSNVTRRYRVTGESNGHWLAVDGFPNGGYPIPWIVDPTGERGFGATSTEGAFYVLPRCGTAAADVSGRIASNACCPVEPRIAGTARAVRGGSEVITKVTATGLRHGCGTARLSWNTTTGRGGFQKLRRSGDTLTGTARLTRGAICTSKMTATVQESDAVGAAELPFSGDLPVLTGTAVRGPTGQTTLMLKADRMRPQSDCGTPTVDAEIAVAGARRVVHLTVQRLQGKPQAFVARATLPPHTCFTTADFIIRQRDIESSQTGVRVLGTLPTVCMLGP
jgi:hypothetical protein